MNHDKRKYEATIKLIIVDALDNFIRNGVPEELEFRMYVNAHKLFYRNRLQNAIVKMKPDNKLVAIEQLSNLLDVIKETDYAKFKAIRELDEVG